MMVLVEKPQEEKSQSNYKVYGLLPGGDFKDPDDYDEYHASYLKLDGYGMACGGMELSQHGKTITIEQERAGGALHIKTEHYEE